MYHSINFGDKNTWDDWRLVPSSRPVFNPPEQKTKVLEIPGGDGVIDLSTSLTGYPVFQNRTGSFEFYVMNDFKEWQEAYSDIMDYLHGRTMKAILEDDPEYYYEGRFTVNSWASEKDYSKITIDYDVGPYKWSINSPDGDWLWNPFNFETDTIEDAKFSNITVNTTVKTMRYDSVLLGRAPVCPSITVATVTSTTKVRIRFVNETLGIDETKDVTRGTYQFPEFIIYGESGVTITLQTIVGSSATVSINFRKGRL